MTFPKYQKPPYPRRQWLIEGEADTGKSTLMARLQTPMLIVDADHRWDEVAHLVGGDIFRLSQDPLDNIDPDRIAATIAENIRGSGVKTIVVDSLTSIITPLIVRAFRENLQGVHKNRVAAYAEKATAMRLLQDVITGTGTDVAWVYHVYQSRNASAQEVERTTITELELARILRSANMRLRTRRAKNFQVEVLWCRTGRSGFTLEDETGNWEGMPEKIEAAAYHFLTEAEIAEITQEPPKTFPTPAEAIRWGMDQGVFNEEHHAQHAYEMVKRVRKPESAQEMRDLWVAEVRARVEGDTTIPEEERSEN